jgi:hypothetical protein
VSLQYGLKAIAVIESGKKPASLDSETWALVQGDLAELYQQTAILYLASGNTQEAKARLAKASTLSPLEPANYALLARVITADYLIQTDAYEAMPDGKPKQDAQKQLETQLDSMIDAYAHAAGLAGRAGTLAPGRAADLVAWAFDPAAELGSGDAVRAGRARLTVVDGEVVMQQ